MRDLLAGALLAAALLLPLASRADAQGPDTAATDSARRADSSGRADSLGRRSRARELKGVKVVAARARAAYVATSSRTATKTDTPLRDTPQSATVLTRSFIADQSMQSMADAVRFIPGVTMGQGEGHRDAPVIRGQSSTADFFVDGVRDDAQYLRDLYNVERVEALKGSNAMIFGRGGGGGIINQVRREAPWSNVGTVTLEGGSFEHKRGTLDIGGPLGEHVATRFDAMYERSQGFRNASRLQRRGVTPTATIVAGSTVLRLDYENFHDDRTVDRGIPSFRGIPSPAPITTFFGDPTVSHARADVHGGGVVIDRALGHGFALRNRT